MPVPQIHFIFLGNTCLAKSWPFSLWVICLPQKVKEIFSLWRVVSTQQSWSMSKEINQTNHPKKPTERISLRRCSLQKQIATLAGWGVLCAFIAGCKTTPLLRWHPSCASANMQGPQPPHSQNEKKVPILEQHSVHCISVHWDYSGYSLQIPPGAWYRFVLLTSTFSLTTRLKNFKWKPAIQEYLCVIWSHCNVLNVIAK